ncbi:hypothetical protein GSI_12296 [Ganoderma sinense ZZ0214-1]|uniref:BTB domain-containing protein n=1 Tax=Ganoderma sinense ZZ0214-1 TaxID=1077348 RepID=A0A2G8RYZ0_9APHY|nr:hypothetical protein GSI_12296 [Ganoderma sinense ZZ0214-1]
MSRSHDSEARPTKRTRLSDNGLAPSTQSHSTPANSSSSPSSAVSTSNLQRHPEIWFDDGNIVLVAEKTAFRIYRGLLVAQSTVFSDMFASSTSSPHETFDGSTPSTSPQVENKLSPTKEEPLRTFDEVSAVIRLAHKYHIPQVQHQALSFLREHHFTHSFPAFSHPLAPPGAGGAEIAIAPVHAIGAVNLARLTDTPSMLPLALYRCAYLGAGALLDGWTRADGTVERLSDADLRLCLAARVALANERFFLVSRVLDATPSARCPKRGRCHTNLLHMLTRAMREREVVRAEEEEAEADPDSGGGVLRDWGLLIEKFRDGKALCGSCVEELGRRAVNERKRVWNRLPEVLGIKVEVGDWEECSVVETNPRSLDSDSDE